MDPRSVCLIEYGPVPLNFDPGGVHMNPIEKGPGFIFYAGYVL